MRRATHPLPALAAALAVAACDGAGGAPSVTMPSQDRHTARWFPTNAGSVHAAAQCDDCHGGFDSFRQFDCVHCHAGQHSDAAAVGAWHAGVAGFAFDSAACYGCHRDGRGTFVNHAAFFPIAAGTKHETAGCLNCHLDRANRLLLGCAGCHGHEQPVMAAVHGLIAGYAFDSALCVRCHADAQVNRVAAHLPLRITPGARHSGPDPVGTCLVCHPGSRGDKPWGADFTAFTCLGCHDPFRAQLDAAHARVSGYAFANCYSCHPSGSP